MPYISSEILSEVLADSFSGRIEHIERQVVKWLDVNKGIKSSVLGVFEDSVLFLDKDKNVISRLGYVLDEQGNIEPTKIYSDKRVNVIEDGKVPSFIAGRLKDVVKGMLGESDFANLSSSIREIVSLVDGNEIYWAEDILESVNELIKTENKWSNMYFSNEEKIRTSLYGRIKDIESQVPNVRYSKIGATKINKFIAELKESVKIVVSLLGKYQNKLNDIVLVEDIFWQSVRDSLLIDVEKAGVLLGKSSDMLSEDNVQSVAETHDKMAGRVKQMAVLIEYIEDNIKAVKTKSKEK